jgi:hypothetical protein
MGTGERKHARQSSDIKDPLIWPIITVTGLAAALKAVNFLYGGALEIHRSCQSQHAFKRRMISFLPKCFQLYNPFVDEITGVLL